VKTNCSKAKESQRQHAQPLLQKEDEDEEEEEEEEKAGGDEGGSGKVSLTQTWLLQPAWWFCACACRSSGI
jgi:hypothetical protein